MIAMIPIDLDIDMLRCFMAVAETESFTRAGKTIGLTQSGVSVKIRRLEERLGSPLFNRTSKQLALTLEGEVLMDYAPDLEVIMFSEQGEKHRATLKELLPHAFNGDSLPSR